MTILQQPDVLSLSGNIKEFRIGTTETISFVLKQGDEEIIAQSYEPGADNIVTINIRDIVHARLSFQFKNTSLVYEQTTLVANFKAVVADTEIDFKVLRCGIDRFVDTATSFLTQNFLTWQPNVKPVTYYSPEFLTYYTTIDCIAKLHAYFTDETGTVVSQNDLDLAQFAKDKAYTIPLQYASVAEKLGNKMPAYYDVWIEDLKGDRLTYIQRYYASDIKSETEHWVLFENSLGGIDTFRAYGSTAFTGEHTHNIAEIDDVSLEYRVDTSRKFQKDTGYLDRKERAWLLDFFPSLKKYLYTGDYVRSIIVVESNVTYTDKELPSNYTFTYKYADARPLLNLPRTDAPLDVLEITVPEVGSFSVPPRLIEFPRLPISEGALFPVQDPYAEKWSSTTAGSLSDFIIDRISGNYGGGGGIGHQHTNIDLLQLLSYVNEYLLIAGKKAKVGYADEAYSFVNNIAKEIIRFERGFISDNMYTTNYSPGTFGSGGCIRRDPDTGQTYIEVDKAYIRMKAIFNSLEIKEAYHVGGEQIQTLASIKCTQVEHIYREALFDSDHKRLRDSEGKYLFALLTEPVYRCYFVNDDGEKAIVNQFVVGDFAQCRQFDIKAGVYEGVSNRYYWRYVVGIGDNYIDLSANDCEEGSDIPEAGDTIIQLGNRTDADRQNAIIVSVYGEYAPSRQMLAGINSYSLDGKVYIEEGFDKSTGQFYTKHYGHSYTGSMDESSYMRYSPEKGVEVAGASIIVHSGKENVWEVNKQGQNIIGNPKGERVVTDGELADIRIYDKDNKLVNTFEGKHYNSIQALFPGTYPELTLRTDIPSISVKTTANKTELVSLVKAYALFNERQFYVDEQMFFVCTPSYFYKNVYKVNGITYGTGKLRFRIIIQKCVDATFETIEAEATLFDQTQSADGSSFVVPIGQESVAELEPKKWYRPVLYVELEVKGSGSSYAYELSTLVSLSSFQFYFRKFGYMSKFYANGFGLGTSDRNIFAVTNTSTPYEEYMEMFFENDGCGLKIDMYNLLAKYNSRRIANESVDRYGIIGRVVVSGKIRIENGSITYSEYYAFDRSDLTVSKHDSIVGAYVVKYPVGWKNLDIGNLGYVTMTLRATYSSSYSHMPSTIRLIDSSYSGFIMYAQDDANNKEYYVDFEVKYH